MALYWMCKSQPTASDWASLTAGGRTASTVDDRRLASGFAVSGDGNVYVATTGQGVFQSRNGID
ncbi:MAG: hypothetical protein ACYC9X_05145 [Dehalococcoidia bacterium]